MTNHNDPGMNFTPYRPPVLLAHDKNGGGPATPASSLVLRLSPDGTVTPNVIAAAAWALSYMRPMPASREDLLLRELGLEWKETPMGARLLQPKPEYLK